MSPTNEQIMAEVMRRTPAVFGKELADTIIEVMREGWTPPEPVVDPDLLAFREWFADRLHPNDRTSVITGRWDANSHAQAYRAGARMAREQERERAKVLVDQAKAIIDQHARLLARLPLGIRAEIGIEWQTMMDATASFYAKYQGEA